MSFDFEISDKLKKYFNKLAHVLKKEAGLLAKPEKTGEGVELDDWVSLIFFSSFL